MTASLPQSLVLIGAGKMGGAMLEGWLRIGIDPRGISLIDPKPSDEMVALANEKGMRINPSAKDIPAADVVVLSKFGKLEAAGGGLAPAFRAAAEAGKPVLTSVSGKQRDAWRGFVPDAAELAADGAALAGWWRAVGGTPTKAA